jgi:hypothetical protein
MEGTGQRSDGNAIVARHLSWFPSSYRLIVGTSAALPGFSAPVNAINLNFEYPDGPFHNTFTWVPETKKWVSLMEIKDKSGKWINFAEDTFAPN